MFIIGQYIICESDFIQIYRLMWIYFLVDSTSKKNVYHKLLKCNE